MNRVPLVGDSGSTSGSDSLSDGGDSTDISSLLSDIDSAILSDLVDTENAESKKTSSESSSSLLQESQTLKRTRTETECKSVDVKGLDQDDKPRQVRKRRKRAKTAEEKKQRALERKMKNRESANRSRMKTINELNHLRKENAEQAKLIRQLKEEMEQMRAHNRGLQRIVDMSFEADDFELEATSLLESDWSIVDEKLSTGYCYNETVVFGPYIISTPLESLVACVKRRSNSYVQSICIVAGRPLVLVFSRCMSYFFQHINSLNRSTFAQHSSLSLSPNKALTI